MNHCFRSGFYGKMLTLAIPISLQQLLTSCAQLIDTAMVVGLGNSATAAIGVAGRWAFLLNLAVFGISSGVATLTAQNWGIRNLGSIHRSFGIGLLSAVAAGFLYTFAAMLIPEQLMRVFTSEQPVIAQGAVYLRHVAPYGVFFSLAQIVSTSMRSTEDVHTPLLCAGISVTANTVLNYLLIGGHFGFPALGLQGAALATTIAMALQLVLLVFIGHHKKSLVFSNWGEVFRFDRAFLSHYFRICTPVMINEFMWGVGTNIYTMVFARQGSENFAAYTIFSSIEQIVFVFFLGTCSAASIMVGMTVGAGGTDEAYRMGRRFMRLMPVLGIVLGGLLILVRYPVLRLLPIETEGAVHTAAAIMVAYSLWLPIRNVPYIAIVGIFRAGGDTKAGMLMDVVSLFLVGIPTVCAAGFLTEIPFPLLVGLMYVSEDIPKVIMCLIRFFSKKWIHQLTGPQAGI